MADLDLGTALQMFQQSTNQLAFSRALNGANDAVNQVRASEADDGQKHAQLQQISNQLVGQMAQFGASGSQIQAVSQSVNPQFGSSADMFRHGIMTGNHSLMDQATQAQKFEEKPNLDKIDEENKWMGPYRQMMLGNKISEENVNIFSKFSKDLDPTQAVRNAFGKAEIGVQAMDRMNAIAGNAKPGSLVPEQVKAMAMDLGTAITGGAITEGELHSLAPNTAGMKGAQILEYIKNNPQAANQAGLVDLYKQVASRETGELRYQQADAILSKAQAQSKNLYKRDPDAFKNGVSAWLNHVGVQVKPEDVQVDGKGQLHIPQLDQADTMSDTATSLIRQSYQVLNSKDTSPDDQAKAQKLLASFNITSDMSPSQAVARATKEIRKRALGAN